VGCSGPQQRGNEDAKARKNQCKRWRQSVAPRNMDAWSARDAWRRRLSLLRATIDWVPGWRAGDGRPEEQPAREALWPLRACARQSVQAPRYRRAGTWERGCAPIVRDLRHRDRNGITLSQRMHLVYAMHTTGKNAFEPLVARLGLASMMVKSQMRLTTHLEVLV
jgi:hypothetical protein